MAPKSQNNESRIVLDPKNGAGKSAIRSAVTCSQTQRDNSIIIPRMKLGKLWEARLLRTIGGIIAGVVVAAALVVILETIGHLIFPPPEGVDLKDPETLKTLMNAIPVGAKVAVLIAWFGGALGGGIVAKLVTKKSWSPWVITAFMLAMCGFSLTMFPHPVWMIAGAIALPVIAGFFATKVGGPNVS
jgi:hypothetical protein